MHRQTCTFVSFKLGCKALRIVAEHWQGVLRLQRICDRCTVGALNAKRHLAFGCSAFEPLRADNQHLFCPEVAFDMRRVFAHRDQQAVVRLVLACLRAIETDHDAGL